MKAHTRLVGAVMLGVTLVAVLTLAASLSGLQLQPGGPFPGSSGSQAAATPGAAAAPGSGTGSAAAALEVIAGALVLVLLVYVPRAFAGLLNARNILRLALGFLLLAVLVGLLPRIAPGPAQLVPEETMSAATRPAASSSVSPLGAPPPEFRWLTLAALGLGAGLLVFRLLRRRPKPAGAAEALQAEAQQALADLRAGGDFQDVIVRCYMQMTGVLRREQNLERRESMTAHEFEDWLEDKGLPAAPIRRLTALFETVRYGGERLGPQDEQAGLDALTQITEFCRATSEGK